MPGRGDGPRPSLLSRSAAAPAVLGLGVVIVVLVGMSLGASAVAGAVPQNDDWSYIKSALELHSNGSLQLQAWGQMFMLGQLVTAQPLIWIFGTGTLGLDVYGALAMALLLSSVFVLGRRCVGPRWALVLVVVIAVWPGMALVTSSFMTDGPSAALSLLSVALGAAAIERRSRWFMIGCLLAGFFAFTIREQMIVGAAAALIVALTTRGVSRRFRVEFTLGAVVLAGVCAVLEHLRQAMPYPDTPPFGFDTLNFHHLPVSLVPCLFTVGLAVSPLALWSLLRLRGRQFLDPGRVLGWVGGVVALGHVQHWKLHAPLAVVLNNYVTRSGAFPDATTSTVPHVMPMWIWNAVQVLAVIGGVALAGEIVARLAHPRRLRAQWQASTGWTSVMAVYTVLLVVFVVGLAFGGEIQHDRYLITIFPGAGLLLLAPVQATERVRTRRTSWVGGAVLAAATVFLAGLSVVTTVSTDVRDAAVWQAAERLHATGVPTTDINAGADWNGTHATTPTKRPEPPAQYRGQYWTNIFPRSRDCWIVSAAPFRNLRLVARERRRGYGFRMRTVTIYTYAHGPCAAR